MDHFELRVPGKRFFWVVEGVFCFPAHARTPLHQRSSSFSVLYRPPACCTQLQYFGTCPSQGSFTTLSGYLLTILVRSSPRYPGQSFSTRMARPSEPSGPWRGVHRGPSFKGWCLWPSDVVDERQGWCPARAGRQRALGQRHGWRERHARSVGLDRPQHFVLDGRDASGLQAPSGEGSLQRRQLS